jgi:SAM-dependent methyltransferase
MGALSCNICGNTAGIRRLTVREKMRGTLEPFEYAVCPECGHLHLLSIPGDMGAYYGQGYYSYSRRQLPWWWRWLHRVRNAAMLGGKTPVGRLFLALKKPWYADWLSAMQLHPGDHFLDVGCGAGNFLRELQASGLDCTGIDPFLPGDEDTPEGVHLRRRDIKEEKGIYKGILFSHSLEHVPDPGQNLECARSRLENGGSVVIRIPLADSLAFWRYGADWFQLDAPRHLNLFTQKSFSILARKCGFEIAGCWHDSNKDQFWASEEYRMGICMNDPRSFAHDSRPAHFSRKDIARFARWAKWANDMGIGDQAAFLLRPLAGG